MRALLPLAPLFLLAACGSARFERAWEASAAPRGAAATAAVASVAIPSGAAVEPRERWEGSWRSAWNGHSGGLRGLLWRVDEQHLHIWFLSTYARILSFEHATLFHLTPRADGSFTLAGQQDLGALAGGVYRYEGTLDDQHFEAHYTAENGDHGTFELRSAE